MSIHHRIVAGETVSEYVNDGDNNVYGPDGKVFKDEHYHGREFDMFDSLMRQKPKPWGEEKALADN